MNDSIEEQSIEVKALENFLLYIKFKNNEEKIYDMKEMLKFDYYKKDYGHFLSKEMFDIFSKFTCSTFYNRKITPVSIGNGHVLRDYFRYVYFPGNGILDEKKSLLEEDKFGDIIPFEIKFNDSASQYDIFSFRETLLGGYIIINEICGNRKCVRCIL